MKEKSDAQLRICAKCLACSETNIVQRKHKKKLVGSTTHQCRSCGSYTFFSGGSGTASPVAPD